MHPQLLALGPIFERECRYVVSRQVFPTKLRFRLQAGYVCDLFFRSRKRLFITLLSTSAYLVFCYLAAGTVPHVTLPPSLEAAEAAAPMISHAEDITTSVVSCLGDSSTKGYPYSGTGHPYPAQL